MSTRLEAIHRQFARMESKKQSIFDLLSGLPPAQYFQQPAPHQWSVAQVAQHLYLSERNSLAYLKKKLSYPDTVPSFHPKSWGGILLIKLVFLTGYKVKAPEGINMWKNPELMTLTELTSKWDQLRLDLISFIEKNENQFGTHLAFRHPFAGRLTMHQMLIFINDHLKHHQKQIKRVLRQLATMKTPLQ